MGTPTTAIQRRKDTDSTAKSRLTPRKHALLYAHRIDPDRAAAMLTAVKSGGSHKVAAEAGGFTSAELKYVFDLAEDGHPGYRDFRDEYFHHRSSRVLTISERQIQRALSDDGTRADRRYALELIEPETFKEEARVVGKGGAAAAFQANQYTFNVVTSWGDEKPPEEEDVVDAEGVEVVE